MTHPYGLGPPGPQEDDGPDVLPVDEPRGAPLEEQLRDERETEPRFHAPVEVAAESREESLAREAEATPDGD